jgi:alpha-glucosidase
MVDNGYDVSDYEAIYPAFGTMEDMDRLIAEAGARDIRILLDLVLNHTSDKHPWFLNAVSDPASPYRDFYLFREGKNGKPPNNWRSIFGGHYVLLPAYNIRDRGDTDSGYMCHFFHCGHTVNNKKRPPLCQ